MLAPAGSGGGLFPIQKTVLMVHAHINIKTIKKMLVAAHSIITEVIPELEDLAEYSKNELRKAKIILDEGLAFYDQDNQIGAIYAIQYEHSGIPQQPFITPDYEIAFQKYQELVIDQGFREKLSNECIDDYTTAYEKALDPTDSNSYFPGLKIDDKVRWWDLDID